MADEIVIKLPEETTPPEPTVIDQALDIVQVATVIADKLEEAGNDDGDVILVIERLDRIEAGLGALFIRLDDLVALVTAPPVVEVVVPEVEVPEELPEEIPDGDTTVIASDDSTVVLPVEEVPVATTPQIKQKKQRKWL